MHISELDRFKEYIEVWRDIPEFEGRYQVSNLGRVQSLDRTIIRKDGQKRNYRGIILTPQRESSGYLQVRLGKLFLLHRLVATAFIDNPKDKNEVNHKDGDKNNNSVKNLEWSTRKHNIKHAFKNGLLVRGIGEDASHVILNDSDVIDIRTRKMKNERFVDVYASYSSKISRGGFSSVWAGRTWKHIIIRESVI